MGGKSCRSPVRLCFDRRSDAEPAVRPAKRVRTFHSGISGHANAHASFGKERQCGCRALGLVRSSCRRLADAMSALKEWESFYVIVGSSAGALIGLQFVVVTLI